MSIWEDNPIVKIECVGHVQKRMGTRLRNLKKGMKGRVLSDDKPIEEGGGRGGGGGRLSDEQINEIQAYYGNAIRANTQNLK